MEKETKTLNFQVNDVEKLMDMAFEIAMPLHKEFIRKGLDDGEIIMLTSFLAVNIAIGVISLEASDNGEKCLSVETKESIWQNAKKVVIDIIQKLP